MLAPILAPTNDRALEGNRTDDFTHDQRELLVLAIAYITSKQRGRERAKTDRRVGKTLTERAAP
jgi:hypothetical protein